MPQLRLALAQVSQDQSLAGDIEHVAFAMFHFDFVVTRENPDSLFLFH